MQKTFIKNLILVLALNLLVKPLYIFGIDRVVQNEVGPIEYGYYFALLNFVYLFQIFNDLGVQNFSHTHFSRYPAIIEKYLPRVFGLKVLTAGFFILLTLLFAWISGYPIKSNRILQLIILNQVFASVIILLRTVFSASGFYSIDSIFSSLDKFLMICVVGTMLWILQVESFQIEYFVIAQSVCFLISIMAALVLLTHKGLLKSHWPIFRGPFIIWMVRRSAPFALVLLLMTLYTRMDGVMIERLLADGKAQAGIYAASYRVLDAFNMLGLLFAGLLLPMFSKILDRHDALVNLISTSFGLLSAISIGVSVICWFYADYIVSTLYINTSEEWSLVFQYLMVTFVAVSWSYIFGTLLTARHSMRTMNSIFMMGLCINLCLNLLLIPSYKSLGATWATLVTQFAVSLGLLIYCNVKLSLNIRGTLVGKLVLYTIIIVTSSILLRSSGMEPLTALVLLMTICCITALASGLISRQLLNEVFTRQVSS